jgi:acyl-coenzyme A synthetase/AMP-(fatty) acid ligase
MLKVSGIFVAPVEIENCLLQHEAVLECAVIGAQAEDGLVKPKAFIVLREEEVQSPRSNVQSPEGMQALSDELKNFVKTHLAPYKYPRWIEFVASLPKNDRGKIDRKQLKQR